MTLVHTAVITLKGAHVEGAWLERSGKATQEKESS
jgi:hypothetical protein